MRMRIMRQKMNRLALFILPIAFPSIEVAQSNAPAVEYQSLLNRRYYEPDGGFLVDDLQMVFPPQGNQKLTFWLTSRLPLISRMLR